MKQKIFQKYFQKYEIQLNLLLFLALGLIVLATVYYFLIPQILNYPAGTYGTVFQQELENTNYITQVLLIALSVWVIFVVLTFFKTRFLVTYNDLINNPKKYSLKEINYVKNKLLTVPYSLFLLDIIIPSIALTVVHTFTINQLSFTTLKLFLLVVSLMTLVVTSIFIYTCNLFKKILVKLPYDDISGLKKDSLKKRIFYNIAPLIFVSILFTSLLGYSVVSIETGNSLFDTYHNSLSYFSEYNQFSDFEDLTNKLHSISLLGKNDYIFIRKSDGTYIDINNNVIHMSDFFNKYLNELSSSNNGKCYEYYGIDCQASTINININGENYIVGVYFYIISTDVLNYFALSFIILLLINVLILRLFSQSLSSDINLISSSFSSMVKNKDVNIIQPLALTSNDEIGKLIISYNQIQKLTKDNIQQIHDNQNILMERERLASLGQLIGGIAHNLKTPIMSISGAAEGINDLVNEFDASIGNPLVNDNDFHDIAKDMKEWIEKIKSYTEYMSDILTAVKGQAVTLSEQNEMDFTIGELFKRVDILMKHELKQAVIYLDVSIKVDENIVINGDINSLVQVINNMLSNAIQAYNGQKEQRIDLIAWKNDNNNIIISIKDYGPGLPDKVKDKLFKEMITTKGKNGTGLGLYMSYSTIKAHFNGDITVETEAGKGTTFNIVLP